MAIAVLVSGGVDSAVALARLVRAHGARDIVAFYLKIWLEDELAFLGSCPWEEDLAFARATTTRLGVPLEVLPLQRRYHEAVVARAIDELARGRTPSPDLHCNTEIKYGAFADAIGSGFEVIATGHYARVDEGPGGRTLRTAVDPVKDQTYFLSRLTPAQLARAAFPIGDLHKASVRALAKDLGLPSAERPDSQGICFLGRIPYPAFVRAHLGDRPGPIVDIDSGRTLGEHRGLWFHTIGQRQGLGLGGGPWYVVDKDLTTRALYVTHARSLASHLREALEIEDLRWPGGEAAWARATTLKLRHGPGRIACRVVESLAASDRLLVHLAEPEAGVVAGQFVVLYDGELCLGSGVIR